MLIKIYNGTPSTENRCVHCRSYRQIRGQKESEEIHVCEMLQKPLPFKVSACSYFQFHDAESLRAAANGALWLSFDKQRRKLMVASGPYDETYTVREYLREPAPVRHSSPALPRKQRRKRV